MPSKAFYQALKYPTPANLVVNPTFLVGTYTANATPANQWEVEVTGTGLTATVNSAVISSNTSNGSRSRLRLQVITADATITDNERVQVIQTIEGLRTLPLRWGESGGKYAAVRFGLKAPVGNYCMTLTGGSNTNIDFLYTKPIPVVSTADTEYEFIIPPPAANATVTWNNNNINAGLTLRFVFVAGPNISSNSNLNQWGTTAHLGLNGMTNGVAANTNVFELYDVGVYAVDNANSSAPPFVQDDYNKTLEECNRYHQIIPTMNLMGYNTNVAVVSAIGATVTFTTPMRTTPQVALSSLTNTRTANCNTTSVSSGSFTFKADFITGTAGVALATATATANARMIYGGFG